MGQVWPSRVSNEPKSESYVYSLEELGKTPLLTWVTIHTSLSTDEAEKWEIMKDLAGKLFGIRDLRFRFVDMLPIHFLVEFCRGNSRLELLALYHVSLAVRGTRTLSVLPIENPRDYSFQLLFLHQVTLDCYEFVDATAAVNFAKFIACLRVPSLALGSISADTERFVCKFIMPTVKYLKLEPRCGVGSFQVALKAGRKSVFRLKVALDNENATAKLNLLSSFILRTKQLCSLRLCVTGENELPMRQLCQAVDTSVTITTIDVINAGNREFTDPEEQLLQEIAARNRELDQFDANPSTYPIGKLPTLMSQFDNCSYGRFLLASRLLSVISFEALREDILQQSRRKKRKIE